MSHASIAPLKRFAQELVRCTDQEARLLFAKEFMSCRDELRDFHPSSSASRHATSQALLKLTVSTLYSGKYAAELLPYAATLISSKNLAHKTVGYQVLTYVLPHMPVTIWEHFLLNSLQGQISSPSVDDQCLALQFMANNMPPSRDLLEATGPLILTLLAAKSQPYDVTIATFKICCKFVCCARDSMAFLESPMFLQLCTAGLQASKRALDHHAAAPAKLDRFIVMRTATAFVHSFAVLSQEVDLQRVQQFAEAELSERRSLSPLLQDCVHSLIACYYFTTSRETFPDDTSTYHTVIDPFWQIETLQTIQLCSDELNHEFAASEAGKAPPKARRRLQEIVRYMLATKRRQVRSHGGPDQAYSNIRAALLLEVTNVAISFPYMQSPSTMRDICYRITNLMGEERGRRSNLLGMKHLDLLLERNPVEALPPALLDTLRKSTLPYLEGLLRKTGLVISDCVDQVLGGDGGAEGDDDPHEDQETTGKRHGAHCTGIREGEDTTLLLAGNRATKARSRGGPHTVHAPTHINLRSTGGQETALRVSGQHLLLGARVLLRLTSLGLYSFEDCVELLQPLAQGGDKLLEAYSLSQLNALLLETLRSKELLQHLDYFDLASYVIAVLRQRLGVVRSAAGEHKAEDEPEVPKRAPRTLLSTLASGEGMGGAEAFAQRAFQDLEGIAEDVARKYLASGNECVYDLHMLVTGALELVAPQGCTGAQGVCDKEVQGCIAFFCSQIVLSMMRHGCMASCDSRVILRMSRALGACASQVSTWEKYSACSDSCALASLLLFTFVGDNDRTLRYLSWLSAHMSQHCLQEVYTAVSASKDGAGLRVRFLGENAGECLRGRQTAESQTNPAASRAAADVKEQVVLPSAPSDQLPPQAAELPKPTAIDPLIELLEA